MAIKIPKLSHTTGRILDQISVALQTIFVLIVTVFIVLPVILPFLLPIYLFRFLLFKSAPYIRPKMGKMLSTRSAMFGSDDMYNKPQCTLQGQIVSEGEVDLVKLQRVIQDNLIDAKFPNGELKHPELKQYVTQWLGFTFWKDEIDFKLEEHVRFFDPELDTEINSSSSTSIKIINNNVQTPISESKVADSMSYLSTLPFNKGKSPWDIIVTPNFVSDFKDDGKLKNVLIFRWHHCLMDGFGMLKFISGMSTLDFSSVSQSQSKSDSKKSKSSNSNSDPNSKTNFMKPAGREKKSCRGPGFLKILWTFLSAPYVTLKASLESIDPIASNTWHVPEGELAKKWKSRFSDDFIPINYIKEIKDHYSVSFNAVVLTGITGAMRNFMLKNKTRKLPDYIHAGTPFPFKGHPDKLRNFWSICTVKLPIREKSSLKRLLYIERKLKGLKASPAPLVMFLSMPLIGGVLNCMIRQIMKNRNTTAIISTMPGPQKEFYNYKGSLVLQQEFFVSLGAGNTGMGFSSISYNGSIRVGATLDTSLFSDAVEIKSLANGFYSELEILKELMCVEV